MPVRALKKWQGLTDMGHREFQLLATLKTSAGYKALEEEWLTILSAIQARRDVAASRGQESAWRYYAGLEKGAKQIMMCLEEVLLRMEQEGGGIAEEPSEKISRLLEEARGEKK